MAVVEIVSSTTNSEVVDEVLPLSIAGTDWLSVTAPEKDYMMEH